MSEPVPAESVTGVPGAVTTGVVTTGGFGDASAASARAMSPSAWRTALSASFSTRPPWVNASDTFHQFT